jgi:F0F1-type ATP synthase membrane subunit b/b'
MSQQPPDGEPYRLAGVVTTSLATVMNLIVMFAIWLYIGPRMETAARESARNYDGIEKNRALILATQKDLEAVVQTSRRLARLLDDAEDRARAQERERKDREERERKDREERERKDREEKAKPKGGKP